MTNFKLIGAAALSFALVLASPAMARGGGGGHGGGMGGGLRGAAAGADFAVRRPASAASTEATTSPVAVADDLPVAVIATGTVEA